MGNKTILILMFFVINFTFNILFDNTEESWKIFLCQMVAIVLFAINLWLVEDKQS